MNNAYIRAQQLKVKEAKFPFVKIGEQYWTTKNLSLAVTPRGNTIPEIKANGNVEKVANITFDISDWGSPTPNVGYDISNGLLNMHTTNAAVKVYKSFSPLIYKGFYWKITYTISNYVSGNIWTSLGVGWNNVIHNANGTYTDYGTISAADASFLYFNVSINTTCSIDNVSVQEIGWSGSQELYDGIYAQTIGTVEQKTYAAVKAAAMWCNYNNDAVLGGIYGKLYNWFAVKLFQMDIDYYNAANPTKKWASGFRVPTQAEFQTLSNFLGGDAVSGGKLKETGLSHWSSPNTGADNSSGLTILPSGLRSVNGSFAALYTNFRAWPITETNSTNSKRILIDHDSSASSFLDGDKRLGCSIRLIKA